MTRGLNPFLWLICIVLICIWGMNYRERSRYNHTFERQNQPFYKQPGPVTPTPNQEVTTELQPIKHTSKENSQELAKIEKDNNTKPIRCTQSFKRKHYIRLEFKPGRTGNALFQVFCLLSLSKKYCHTAVVERRNRFFKNLLDPVFEIENIERPRKINTASFHNLTSVLSPRSTKDLSNSRYNWTLMDRCTGYKYLTGQEKYIRSSVHFREDIRNTVDSYMEKNFAKRSTAAIHVRRTDKMTNEHGYDHSNLEWYKPYITRAMALLKTNDSDLAFIFVSDDLPWCAEEFKGPDMFFSPCTNVGCDLALVTSCDHVVITIGTYGWMGAWLGEHKTVIYNTKYVPPRFYKKDFYLPSWVGIE